MQESGLEINAENWLEGSGVQHVLSSFFNDRPQNLDIDLLVIHCISLPEGAYGNGYIQKLFMGALDSRVHPSFETLRDLKVSAHLMIERSGKIFQFVPFDKRAWHAGISEFQGRENCNDYSIGIELEGTDSTKFTDEQYRALNQIITVLQSKYPGITPEKIVGHCDIAPGRKKDPGVGFEWKRVHAKI
jgi:AmpD protein